ncbi:MAG: hypothetical protein KDA75_13780 [Planctomycetaceae bacterium]|nr:hypothetical protein [Planctomycetaceae bacterium]
MARHEADREDLLAEAQALYPRAEWRLPGRSELVTAGIRRDQFVSIYFGGDPCYHFDHDARLRRAFVADALYRTHGTTLARLTRERAADETVLNRVDLSKDAVEQFLSEMQCHLNEFIGAVDAGEAELLRSVAEPGQPLVEIVERLRQCAAARRLAPAIPTRLR